MKIPVAVTFALFALGAAASPLLQLEIPPGGYAYSAIGSTGKFIVKGEPLISPGPWRGDPERVAHLLGASCMETVSGLGSPLAGDLLLRLTDLLAVPMDVGRGARPGFMDVDDDGLDELVVFDDLGGIHTYRYPDWELMGHLLPPGTVRTGADLDRDGVEEQVSVAGDGAVVITWQGLRADTLSGFSFGEPSGVALGDVGGDGLADLVLGLPDGRVLVCRNRGTASSPLFIPWSMGTRELLPMRPGAFAAPVILSGPDPILLVGTGSAGLKAWIPEFVPGDPWPVRWMEVEPPAVEEGLLNLTPAVSRDVLLACERNGIVLAWGIETGEELESRIPRIPGTYPVVTAGTAPFVEGPVLIAGTREGGFYLLQSPESPSTGWEPLQGLPLIPSGAPAFYGEGMVIGSGEGDIRYFVPDAAGAWTEIMEDSPFSGIDVGEYSVPSFADMDGDGRDELLIGNARGELTCRSPDLSVREGMEMFLEVHAWEFMPSSAVSDLSSYYSRYYGECSPLMTPSDIGAVRAFAVELTSAPPRIRDEIAYCIANTPTEVLREMYRNGDSDLFRINALAVYEMADRLPYAELTDTDGSTELTLDTRTGPVTIGSEEYYRFVVHPRVLFEIPARVDASFWETPPDTLGMTEDEWYRHDPGDLYSSGSETVPLFWRTVLPDDTLHGPSLMETVSGALTVRDAVLGLCNYQSHSQPAGIMEFGYLSNDLQPMVIHRKAYGSCGEQSILQTALCRALLIPSYVVGCRGEDHQWNEFLDPSTGRWTHWDVNYGSPAISHIWVSGEGVDHGGKTISTITAFGPDDVTWQTTGNTLAVPGSGYMPGDSGYTPTASVSILVTDARGAPVEGAMVLARSHWDRQNMVSTVEYTDLQGRCAFDLGWEPYGGYTIDVISPFGAGGSSSISFEEGGIYSLEYRLPGTAPADRSVLTPDTDEPGAVGPGILPVSDLALSYPVSYYTGQLYSLDLAEEDEEPGYRGARWFSTEPEPVTDGLLYMDGANFAAFSAGADCRALQRPFEPVPGDTCFALLDNSGSMFAWRSVTLSPEVREPAAPLEPDEIQWLSSPVPPRIFERVVSQLIHPEDPQEEGHAWISSIEGIELRQDDPDDPLSSGWILGPFMVPAGERSLLIASTGLTGGMDMDMYLFADGNGNRQVDGMHELTSSSTSPTSNEEIYLPDPDPGTVYWLYLLGWSVPEEGGTLNLGMGFEPELLLVDSMHPVGTAPAAPDRFSFRLASSVDHPVAPVAAFGEIEIRPVSDGGGEWYFRAPSEVPLDAPLELRIRDGSGETLETVEWELLIDTEPPVILGESLSVDSGRMLLVAEFTAFDAPGGIVSAELLAGEDTIELSLSGDSLWSGSLDLLTRSGTTSSLLCRFTDGAGNLSLTDTLTVSVPERPAVMFGFIQPTGVTYDHAPLVQVAPDFGEEPGDWIAEAFLQGPGGEVTSLEPAFSDGAVVQFRPPVTLPDGLYRATVTVLDHAGDLLGTHSWEFTISSMGGWRETVR